MTHPAYVRDKAREMRVEKRLTIDEIAERLALPRTTIFHWVRDLPLPRSGFDPARASAARRRAAEANRAKHRVLREEAYAEGLAEFGGLSEDPTFRDFVCLYLAEGCKRDRNRVSICNSDPLIVGLGARWITRLSARKVTYSVQYHADQHLPALMQFWSDHLQIERTAIVLQRKSNSNQLKSRTWRTDMACLW